MEINISLLVIITLSICEASLRQDEPLTSCKATKTEVTVTPTSSKDIINSFNFDIDLTQFLIDMVTIETPIVKESLFQPNIYNEDQYLNVTELISKYGFTPEVHEVTRTDGYELTIHRIVGNGPLVFMMHGLLCSTDEWITAGPGNSLAFELASAGYDVWMGNARGNKYSKTHISLSPECDEFWEFSWDQISLIDVPTMMDYALHSTNKTHLSYVGLAQGTTNILALCSDMPEYNEKISIAVLLAPVVYVSNWKSPLFRLIALNPEAIYKFTQFIGLNNPAPANELQSAVTELLCGNHPLSKFLCSNIVGTSFGYGRGQLDIARLPVFFGHFPAGASVRQFIHYGQAGRSGKFQKFDFTKEKNLEMYGSEQPPEYKPEKLTVPVAVFYGKYDWLAHVTDVYRLLDKLSNVVNTTYLENYGHVEQIWGKNCKKDINEPVVELISKCQK